MGEGVRIAGRIDVALVLPPTGEGASAEVAARSFEPDARLEACLLQLMRRARIPPVDEPTTFTVRFELSAPDATPPEASVDEGPAIRAEIASDRRTARCLTRLATRLERLLQAYERAGPRRRASLSARIAEARLDRVTCHAGTLGSIGSLLGAGSRGEP